MTLELIKWSPALKQELIDICNDVDRTFLSNRLPYPYTEESADWWLGMVSGHDGKDGVFRAISVDGKIVGNISVEQKADVYCKIAFSELDIIRITGLVYAPNIASRRVLEKNAFIQEGLQRNAVYKDGNIFDLCVYGKLK